MAARVARARPSGGRPFGGLAPAASKAKNYDAWTKQFAAVLSASEALELFESSSSGIISAPDEPERDFRARLHQSSREERDRAVEALRRKYAPRQAAIAEQQRQLEADLRTETAALDAANEAATEKLERVVIKPKKTNVTVKIVALVWTA